MERIVKCEIPSDQDNSICAFCKHAEGDCVDFFKDVTGAEISQPLESKGLDRYAIVEAVNLDPC